MQTAAIATRSCRRLHAFCSRRVCERPCCSLLIRKTAKPPDSPDPRGGVYSRSLFFLSRSSGCFCFVCGFDSLSLFSFPCFQPFVSLSLTSTLSQLGTFVIPTSKPTIAASSFHFPIQSTFGDFLRRSPISALHSFARTWKNKAQRLLAFTTRARLYAPFPDCIHFISRISDDYSKIESRIFRNFISMRFGVVATDFEL